MKFEKAMRKKAKLRLALTGPSGSGKTYSALMICKSMGGKTAVIDTEKGSASLYSNEFDFDVLELIPHSVLSDLLKPFALRKRQVMTTSSSTQSRMNGAALVAALMIWTPLPKQNSRAIPTPPGAH